MKKTVSLALFLVFMVACLNEFHLDTYAPELEIVEQKDLYSVSSQDVMCYINALDKTPAKTKSGNSNMSVTPIVDIYGDTIFFAVNLYPGWKLFSSDKRTPAVLAECPIGDFDVHFVKEAMSDWLEFMARDVRNIKESNNDSLIGNDIRDVNYADIWHSVLDPLAFARERQPLTRSAPGYDLYSSTTEEELFQEIDHLTQSRWYQSSPYNNYSPYRTDNSTLRASTGCVAVAGAQMLYYLHGKIGRPVSAPTQGYCYGNIDSNTWDFYNFDTSAFDDMLNNKDTAALLIGLIGRLVNTDYGNNGSGAYTSDLVDVFEDFGISCEYGSYDQNIVKVHLLNNMPVIARADGVVHTILGIPYDYDNPHAFIIDGFRSKRYKYTNTYVWAWTPEDADSLGTRVYDFSNYYVEVTYSEPYVTQIKMNWGYMHEASYNTWYTLTGNWHVAATSPESDYDYRRHLIYNFSAL